MIVCDNSILSAVNTCDLKAALRYVLHLTSTEERLELDAGTAVHEALAVWHKGGTKDAALTAFDTLYKPKAVRTSVEDRLSWSNVRRVLNRFMTHFTQYPLPYTVQKDLVEVVFEAPLDEHGNVLLIGRIDQVITYHGRLVIGENKTTGSLSGWWRDKWPMSSQLTTYVYGGKYGLVDGKPLGLPVEEALVLGLELRKLPTSTAKCKEHGLPYSECGDTHAKWEFSGPYPRPDGFIQRWRTNALKAAARFKWMQDNIHSVQDAADKLEQQGQFNGSCVWCEYKDYCRQGVPALMMEANLVKDEWNPRHVKQGGVIQIERQSPSPMMTPSQPVVPASREGVLTGSAPKPANARKVEGL